MEFLNISEDVNWMTKVRGRECQSLLGLFEGLDACRGAAHSLQWSFDLCQGLSVQDGPHAVSAFAVTASLAYVEALIVLAYYGVLLHRCREYWIFGDAARAWFVLSRTTSGRMGGMLRAGHCRRLGTARELL